MDRAEKLAVADEIAEHVHLATAFGPHGERELALSGHTDAAAVVWQRNGPARMGLLEHNERGAPARPRRVSNYVILALVQVMRGPESGEHAFRIHLLKARVLQYVPV